MPQLHVLSSLSKFMDLRYKTLYSFLHKNGFSSIRDQNIWHHILNNYGLDTHYT